MAVNLLALFLRLLATLYPAVVALRLCHPSQMQFGQILNESM
jgi:hypothetical protein